MLLNRLIEGRKDVRCLQISILTQVLDYKHDKSVGRVLDRLMESPKTNGSYHRPGTCILQIGMGINLHAQGS